jgi:hypothetical protein
MPQNGERYTDPRTGITGEWDGSTWRKVDNGSASGVPSDIQQEMLGTRQRLQDIKNGAPGESGDKVVDNSRMLAKFAPLLGGLLGGVPGSVAGSAVNMVANPPQSAGDAALRVAGDVAIPAGANAGLQVGANAIEQYGLGGLLKMLASKGGSAALQTAKPIVKGAAIAGGADMLSGGNLHNSILQMLLGESSQK